MKDRVSANNANIYAQTINWARHYKKLFAKGISTVNWAENEEVDDTVSTSICTSVYWEKKPQQKTFAPEPR